MTSVWRASEVVLPAPREMNETRHAQGRLDWIEVGRGLAAIAVVFAHFTPWQDAAPGTFYAILRPFGGYAVEFFFVLSGFIILYVHRRDIGQPAALARYGWRRLVRIFPTYWLVLAFALPINQLVQIASVRFALSTDFVVRQIFLLPGIQIVGQAWTLRHELLFYGVFALLIAHARIGLTVFLAWMALVLGNLVVNGLPPGQVTDGVGIVLLHYNLDFAIGMVIALAAQHDRLGLTIGVGIACAALFWLISAFHPGALIWYVVMLKPLFGAIVAMAALASRRGIPAPRVLIVLGALSYAIYISHELWGTAVTGFFRRLAITPSPSVLLMCRVGVVLVGSYMIHRLFERPVLRWLGSLGVGGPSLAPAATTQGNKLDATPKLAPLGIAPPTVPRPDGDMA